MSRITLWLIVEDEKDGVIVREILKKKSVPVDLKILKPTGSRGGISRMAQQLEELIKTVKRSAPNDCIVVLHDDDKQTQPNRQDHQQIKAICDRCSDVIEVIAIEAIEAWLLADKGLCAWLGEKARNHDSDAKPKDELIRLLDKAGKPKYTDANLPKILKYLDGSGTNHSPSMKEAFSRLQSAPCNIPTS